MAQIENGDGINEGKQIVVQTSALLGVEDSLRGDDTADAREEERLRLLEIIRSKVTDDRVYHAFEAVDRALFVPEEYLEHAYSNTGAIPLTETSTISQPSMVARMTDLLGLTGEVVLEIGTGSGYSAAILSQLAEIVHTVEIDSQLADGAKERLNRLGFANVEVHAGDGRLGLPDEAPFDRIIVTAAAENFPMDLVDQLTVGGRIVIPVGPPPPAFQTLWLGMKRPDGRLQVVPEGMVRFVSLLDSTQEAPEG
ncbi:MAG: protein-L-isoaspartate(D-aspartate) O-methyltransferase [Candidatus Levybacteria bacterium]|nr:protein-L-isoaspartate(D-aspartate) O-methyltransferase [Candidatus Levybacteria bacterium]